jgi:ribose transport system permease protein
MQDKRTSTNTPKKRMSVLDIVIQYRTILILILLAAVFTILDRIFMHPTNILNMLKRMSYVAISAFGMTFVITLGGLDLSVGGTAAIVGVTLALMLGMGIPLPVAILLCLLIAVVLGALNGIVVVKGRIEPFLVTLATMNIYRGFALVLTGGRPVPIVSETFVQMFGNGLIFNVLPVPILIMAVFFAVTWFLYRKTKYGFYIRAIGGNLEAAIVAGMNVGVVKVSIYIFNAVFAYMTGLILAALMSSGLPAIAADLPLDAISAVILGGTAISGGVGNVLGTLGGALIMAILASGMSLLGAQYPVQILVKGIVIIFAMLIDQTLKARG